MDATWAASGRGASREGLEAVDRRFRAASEGGRIRDLRGLAMSTWEDVDAEEVEARAEGVPDFGAAGTGDAADGSLEGGESSTDGADIATAEEVIEGSSGEYEKLESLAMA